MDIVIEPIRTLVKKFMGRVAKDLDKLSGGRISPNMVTYTGLIAHIPIAWLIATQQYVLAAVLLVVFGLFDTLDGALARYKHVESKKGMFLDSVTDRIKEVILYIGIAYAFIASNQSYFAVWAVAACGAAVVVSYVNAWGEVATNGIKTKDHKTNNSFRTGLMTYDVRMFVLVIGLLTGYLEITVVVLALLSCLTMLQRINNVSKKF